MEPIDTANTSGQGPTAILPPEIKGFSWGGFFLSWIWGIANNTYLAFITFVPLLGFIMLIVLGIKGKAWAWQNKHWESVEHFNRVQRRWGWWGFVSWLAMALLAVGLFFGIMRMLSHSDAAQLGMASIRNNPQVQAQLGTPITQGVLASGNIHISGGGGYANLSLPIEGPKGSGHVFLEACKRFGQWHLHKLVVKVKQPLHWINATPKRASPC